MVRSGFSVGSVLNISKQFLSLEDDFRLDPDTGSLGRIQIGTVFCEVGIRSISTASATPRIRSRKRITVYHKINYVQVISESNHPASSPFITLILIGLYPIDPCRYLAVLGNTGSPSLPDNIVLMCPFRHTLLNVPL